MKGYVYKSDGFPHIDKDPNAILTYAWDWTDWLAQEGATSIQSAVITADAGVTKVGSAVIAGGVVSQTISGGTVGTSYKLVCRVTTTSNLVDDRTIILDVVEK